MSISGGMRGISFSDFCPMGFGNASTERRREREREKKGESERETSYLVIFERMLRILLRLEIKIDARRVRLGADRCARFCICNIVSFPVGNGLSDTE